MSRRRELLLLGAVLAAAAALRFAGIGRESFWLDEGYAVRVASGPPAAIVAAAARETHPPLYYLLLHAWIRWFGASEAAVRSLSALAGMLTVALAYGLGRRLLDAHAGLVAALIVAIAGIQLHYGQEARSYALLAMLAALSWWLAARFLALGRTLDLAGMTVASIASVYTHHAGGFAVAAQALTPLVLPRPPGSRRRLAWWTAHGIVALSLLPWAGVLRAQVALASAWTWVPRPGLRTLAATLAEHAGSPVLALLLLLLAAVPLVRRVRGRIAGTPVGALALWFAIPIAAPFLIACFGPPIYLSRITIVSTVPLALLAAAGVRDLPTRRLELLAVAAILLTAAGPLAAYETGPHRERWREAVADVERIARPGDLVLFDAGYCLRDVWGRYARRSDLDLRALPGSPDSAGFAPEADRARSADRVWLVRSHDGAAGEAMARDLAASHPRALERLYPSRTYELWRPRYYLGIRVERFDRPAR